MASLNPQTLVNEKKSYFLEVPVTSGIPFAGPTPVTIINDNGILKTDTGDILNDSRWSDFPASSGHIDVSGPDQRITATDSQLFFNGQPLGIGGNVEDWSYYNASSGHIDFSGPTQRLTATDTNLVYNGVPLTGGALPDWALYPAVANVDMNGKNLENCAEVKTDKISDRTGNLLINPDETLNVVSDQMNITVGDGNTTSPSKINIVARNGTYGQIDIQADGEDVNGAVYITANGGSIGGTSYGGNITLTANSGPFSPISFTSAIKFNAASVESYAGAIPSVGSLAGYNYVFGNAGVNIQCDVVGSLLPNTSGTVYIFGRLGVEMPSAAGGFGLYVTDIKPYWDGGTAIQPLTIQGRYESNLISGVIVGNVEVKQCSKLDGTIPYTLPSNPNQVLFKPGLDVTGLVSINAQPYVPTQSWATIPASQNVSMNQKSITNCVNINTDTINGLVPRPLAETIASPYTIKPSTLGTTVIYNGSFGGMTMNTSTGVVVEGFYFTFINNNPIGDMILSIDLVFYGALKLGLNTIIYNQGTWKIFRYSV